MSTIRTPLARARVLGSAHSGTGHFWAQRVSAVALVPLTIWFVICLAVQFGASYESVTAWLSSPFQATLLVLYVATVFYHSQLGLRVIVEDYVHAPFLKIATLVVLRLLNTLIGVAAVVSIIMIFVGAL